MTTKLSEKTRIPIPGDIQPGDVLVVRDGQRRTWKKWGADGSSECDGLAPAIHTPDGRSWYEPDKAGWDVVAIERKSKPNKARPDKDAAYLAWMAKRQPIIWGPAQVRRIRAIAKRLNGGVAP